MNPISVKRKIGDREIILETGRMAKLADGSVLVKYGKNSVLVTACMSKNVPEGFDFFPLTVHYIEKFYAAGKIPGGFFKREGRPSEKETLVSRLIDRPIRPLFPDNFFNEVQVIATTLSADQVYSVDIMGIIGASAALSVSPIPFLEPVGGVRIIYKDGQFQVNPSILDCDDAQLNIVAAGTRKGITMVEGGAQEVPKEILLKAMEIAQEHINQMIELVEELVALVKPQKIEVAPPQFLLEESVRKDMRSFALPLFKEANVNKDKKSRQAAVDKIIEDALAKFGITKEHEALKEAKKILEDTEVEVFRQQVLDDNVRPDGRKPDEIRQITIELDVLDNVHGSALFTRGQTQSLGVITLGSSSDVQFIDTIEDSEPRRFMLHYNFPPFSTGEVKRSLAPSRREIGHGNLAHRSIEPMLPEETVFPYTIRIVSEVLESNGSSSMATVCSSSLALMATGVPMKKSVAGIAMGLIWDPQTNKYKVLSDIQGLEDHYGDMDFKVAGTDQGITGFQMDVKTSGIPRDILAHALEQAWQGKEFILGKMNAVIKTGRDALSENAPKIKMLTIPQDEIGSVIGSGGRVIKKIMEVADVNIDIEDDGRVMITSKSTANNDKAAHIVQHIVNGFKRGEVVQGPVVRIEDYGVFIEILPGQTGLIHRSSLLDNKSPRDFKMGEILKTQVKDVDERKRVSVIQIR